MTLRKVILAAFVFVLIFPAADTYFKFFYGRSFFVHENIFTLNIGISSAVVISFVIFYWVIYFAREKKWKSIVKILCPIALLVVIFWFAGNPIKKQDRDLADFIMKNLKEEDVLFSDVSLKNGWRLEVSRDYKLIGEYPYRNMFLYESIGDNKYLITIYIYPIQDVRVSRLGN